MTKRLSHWDQVGSHTTSLLCVQFTHFWGGGGWHDTWVCGCLQLAAPIGQSPVAAALSLHPLPPDGKMTMHVDILGPKSRRWGGVPHSSMGCPLARTWPTARAVALLCVDPTQSSEKRKSGGIGGTTSHRQHKCLIGEILVFAPKNTNGAGLGVTRRINCLSIQRACTRKQIFGIVPRTPYNPPPRMYASHTGLPQIASAKGGWEPDSGTHAAHQRTEGGPQQSARAFLKAIRAHINAWPPTSVIGAGFKSELPGSRWPCPLKSSLLA